MEQEAKKVDDNVTDEKVATAYTCDACGDDLEVAEPSDEKIVRIKPCETCGEDSYESGRSEGA